MTRPTREPDRLPEGRIDLRIDRLVLDGLSLEPGDRERFRAGLESELARLLTEQGLPGSVASRSDHEAPRPAIPVDLRGGSVVDGAARVAQQVYESIHQAVRS